MFLLSLNPFINTANNVRP